MFAYLMSRHATEATTLLTLLITLGLAIIITQKYARTRSKAVMFWCAGIWLFALGVVLEVAFALGIYSVPLIDAYLFIAALLVETLALGSMQLIRTKWMKNAYYVFCIATTTILVYCIVATNPGNLMLLNGAITYVVAGAPPLLVILASSLITFPAAIILFLIAFNSYRKKKDPKLASVMLGVVIVSIAGTLYIAEYPAFLYVAELVGILLLWYGFI